MAKRNINNKLYIFLLPLDVIKYHIFIHLDNKDITAFMMTNKFYYNHYTKEINKNPFVADRIKRIEECRSKFKNEKKSYDIVLDRIYITTKCNLASHYNIIVMILFNDLTEYHAPIISYTFHNNDKNNVENKMTEIDGSYNYNSEDDRFECLYKISIGFEYYEDPSTRLYKPKMLSFSLCNDVCCIDSIKKTYIARSFDHHMPEIHYTKEKLLRLDSEYYLYKYYVDSYEDLPHQKIYDWIDYKRIIIEEKMQQFAC